MARTPINSNQVDAKSPIDVALMSTSIKNNDDDHELRILSLEAGGGGAVSAEIAATAEIRSGLKTNEPQFFRLRFSPFQNILNSGEKIDDLRTGFDPEGEFKSRWIHIAANDGGDAISLGANRYLGQILPMAKGSKRSFRLKKGENYFGISFEGSSGVSASNSVTVTVDGVAVNTAGVTDENGTARSATFSTVVATTQNQQTEWFFGGSLLSSSEQMIVIDNTDSGTAVFKLDSISVGFRSPDGEFIMTTDEQLHVSDGVAVIRGSEQTYDETDLSLSDETGWGRTDSLIGDQSQVLSILEGNSPAMTQAMPNIELAWVAGFTSLRCKNTSLFPTSGFLLMNQPWGQNIIASFTGKTETLINTHQFDGLLFGSTPQQNWTPLTGFAGASGGGAGDFFGDLNINFWASGGLEITTSNNKIDFKVTINGAETTHVATLASGLYAANGPGKLDIAGEIIRAMNAIKDLSSTGGDYFAEYNAETQKWILGATGGGEIDAIDFDFSSGPSVANSVHVDLGFATTDVADGLAYIAGTAKQHEMAKVLQKGSLIQSDDPNLKTNAGSTGPVSEGLDLAERLGFGTEFRVIGNSMIEIYPDPDIVAMAIHFMPTDRGSIKTITIDNGQVLYLSQTDDQAITTTSPTRGKIQTTFISFPRGSRIITIRGESTANFQIVSGTIIMDWLGATVYRTRPPLEKLTLLQSVIKCFDIAPKQLFKTYYGDSGSAFYSPTTNDNIDTITFTGSFASAARTSDFNGNTRATTILNDTVDITFTTQQAGGGISILTRLETTQAAEIEWYLIDGSSASETNSLIQVTSHEWVVFYPDQETLTIIGLPAGQYTLRGKQKDSGVTWDVTAVGIIDGVEPDPNSNTVSDITNNLQSVAAPIHTVRFTIVQDGVDRVPSRLNRIGYKEGKSSVDYSIASPSFVEHDESAAITDQNAYFGFILNNSGTNDFVRSFFFCKSYSEITAALTTNSTTVQAVIDGRNALSTLDSGIQTKAGSAPSVTGSSYIPLFQKNFFLLASGNMSDSTTFLVGDTRGMRVGMKVIIKADAQTTLVRFIATVTTDTNFTITEAIAGFANYTTANNASVTFGGFHTLRFNNDNAAAQGTQTFQFEPLDVVESSFLRRLAAKTKTETVSISFRDIATGADLYYPVHSDGIPGNFRTSTFSSMSTGTIIFDDNLRDVITTAGADLKITSTREVPID